MKTTSFQPVLRIVKENIKNLTPPVNRQIFDLKMIEFIAETNEVTELACLFLKGDIKVPHDQKERIYSRLKGLNDLALVYGSIYRAIDCGASDHSFFDNIEGTLRKK